MSHAVWSVVEARSHLSGLLDRVQRDGCQFISRNGVTAVAVIPAREWSERGTSKTYWAWRRCPAGLSLTDAQIEALFLGGSVAPKTPAPHTPAPQTPSPISVRVVDGP